MEKLLEIGADALRKAALNGEAKDFLLGNDRLYKTLRKAASRYIGGETLEETIPKVIQQNDDGFKCSIEFMGENVKTELDANEATNEFLDICRTIINRNLHSAIALDLSHIGLGISGDLCLTNLNKICEAAAAGNIEVIISAEGTEQTDHIIRIFQQASKNFDNLGITLQAYLYRSADDFEELIREKGRIRIVKGAFDTKRGLSIPRGPQLNDHFLGYIDRLLADQHKCSIATHDHQIQMEAKKLIDMYSPQNGFYEFESLFGIQNEQLNALKEEGYATKLYFVYGKEWYLYLCNRIAEYPMNVFLALADMVA